MEADPIGSYPIFSFGVQCKNNNHMEEGKEFGLDDSNWMSVCSTIMRILAKMISQPFHKGYNIQIGTKEYYICICMMIPKFFP